MSGLRQDQIKEYLKTEVEHAKVISETKLNKVQISDIKDAKLRANIAIIISIISALAALITAACSLLMLLKK